MKQQKKGRWIAISICGILIILIIAVAGIFIYHAQRSEDKGVRQNISTQSVLALDDSFLALDGSFTEEKITDSESALEAISEVADIIGLQDPDDELSIASEETALENTYYRFTQEYEGIPVYGRAMIVSVDGEDNALSLSGNFRCFDGLETEPALNDDEVIEIARTSFGDTATIINEGLTIYSLNEINPELTWKLYVSSAETVEYCFLSAKDGDIVAELPLVYTERVKCSGEDINGKKQSFYAEYENGEYIMVDTERDITIYDANNSTLQREFLIKDSNGNLYNEVGNTYYDKNGNIVYVYGSNYSFTITDEQGNTLGTDGEYVAHLWTDNIITTVDPVTNDSTIWQNDKAVTLMTHISTVYDFWKSEYCRNSYNGKYGAIVGVYNDYRKGDTTNASTYVSPIVPIVILSFGTDNSLDIADVSHEFTHSVERSISNMISQAETGALMEAYSDIFGEIIEDWAEEGIYNNSCDWIQWSRNMISPGSSGMPDTYRGDHWADTSDPSDKNDNGGVHTNSTVISHAAYLMNTGIGGNPAFKSLSTKEIADLFYSTLFVLPSDCTFKQFRTLTENTAYILCKQGRLTEKQRACVSNAFFQVGIAPATILASEHVYLDIYGINGEIYDDYTLYVIKDGEKTSYTGTSVNSNGVTFSGFGEYELQIIDNANVDNVTTLTIQVVEDSGVSQIPIYTQCGISDIEDFIESIPSTEEQTSSSTTATEEINDRERDREIYNQYLTNGGYEELAGDMVNLFSMPENLEIASGMYDMNGDGTYELLLRITDTASLGPTGHAQLSFLLGIEDGNVKEYQQAYFTGGTMLGSSIYFLYDTETQKPVVVVNNAIKDGIYFYQSETQVFLNDFYEPEITWEESTFSRINGEFGSYDDIVSEIKQETTQYVDDGTVFSYYKVNDQYVTEDELGQVAGRFIHDESKLPMLLPGTYDEPVAGSVSSDSNSDNDETFIEDTSWREMYKNVLDSLTEDYTGYGLIYIDNNDVPELYLRGNGNGQGQSDRLYSICEGSLVETSYDGRLIYWEAQGLFQYQGNQEDELWTDCYTMENGRVKKIHEGSYSIEDSGSSGYYWDGQEVSEEQYYTNLNAVSGNENAISGLEYSNSSLDTVLSQIADLNIEGQILRKNVEDSLNIRKLPKHDSDLIGTVDSTSELLYNGATVEGLGSDGQIHNWHYITTGSGMSGWVRGDLIIPDNGSLKMLNQSLCYYRKGVESSLNIRSLPQHDSSLVGTVSTVDDPLAFYGEIGVGYGSDGIIHEWYKITTSAGITGWVRSDLIRKEAG